MAATVPDQNNMEWRFQNTLMILPMQRRIDELVVFFRECSLKELQTYYPLLIESIFGVSNYTSSCGWNLKSITRYDEGNSFDAIFRFLHPQGTLIDIAYKLLGDVYLKYDYSLSYLPANFRNLIQEGNIPPFYMDKLNVDPVTRAPLSFLLNSFELFLFHFAFHLVSPWQNRQERPSSSNETIYLHLSDQFLCHFLPIDTSVVLPEVQPHQTTLRSPPPQVQPVRISKLFKSSFVKQYFKTTSQSVSSQPHTEIWRSEALLHIIIYFWLYVPEYNKSNETKPYHDTSFSPNSSPLHNKSMSNLSYSPGSIFRESLNWQESRASGDHLRVVRNLMKHMHYFANNTRNDGSTMDEMRKSIRNVLKVPLYNFLRQNIHHWPLDSSFLLMLETYLSYIQPWRYQKYNPLSHVGESTHVDAVWMPHIQDNLEAYTAIVSELLSRFARMDLSSPRHAHMIYRLAKVLAEPDLPALLRQADFCAQSRPDPENHVPLFTRANENQVCELIQTMRSTGALVSAADRSATEKTNSSLIQSFRDWFMMSSNEDYSSSDRQATVAYLDHAVKWLSSVFNVTPPELPPEHGIIPSVQPTLLDPSLARKRAASIKYGGHPDLEPIRSTEITSLVRLFHRISTSINEMYGPQIAQLWHRDDVWGRVCKEFFAAPCQYFYFHKTGPGNPAPRVAINLPPRVCLRALAARRFVYFIFTLLIFPYVFNYTPTLFYLTFLVIFSSWVFIKALVSPFFESDSPEHDSFVPLDVSYNE